MKVEAKTFRIDKGKRPKVLFVGNGINKAFDGYSWDEFLDEIKDSEKYPYNAKNYIVPMNLKSVLLTNNMIKDKINHYMKKPEKQVHFRRASLKQLDYINKIVNTGFNYILTTNYSYETECALCHKEELTCNQIKNLMHYHLVNSAQTKYFINTYNEIKSDEPIEVWHIHGEARKPDSIILGNHYYGNLIHRYASYYEKSFYGVKRKVDNKKPVSMNSWIDLFLYGDVYILGFGMDYSEVDLWWLLAKKATLPDEIKGRTFYLEPTKKFDNCEIDANFKCNYNSKYIGSNETKRNILSLYGVTQDDCGITINSKDDYAVFYDNVLRRFQNKA